MNLRIVYRVFLSLITILLTISPNFAQQWGQDQKVIDPDWDRFDSFGTSVSIENNTMAVGVIEDSQVGRWSGKVMIFTRNNKNDTFEHSQTLYSNDIDEGDEFGISVDINGDYLLVGADHEKAMTTQDTFSAGAAYLFKRDSSNNWNQIQKILPPQRQPDFVDGFGKTVEMNDNFLFICAPVEDIYVGQDTFTLEGVVYVYKYDSTDNDWIFHQKLEPDDFDLDEFGNSIIATNDSLFIGLDGGFHSYHLDKQSGNWIFDQKVGDTFLLFDRLGISINYNGRFLFVGATSRDSGDVCCTGSVFCYKRDSQGKWKKYQEIFPNNPKVQMGFGSNVICNDSMLIITADSEDVDVEGEELFRAGAAYIYKLDQNEKWQEHQKLISCDLEDEDSFGFSLAFDGTDIIVGAPDEDEGIGKDPPNSRFDENKGSVYVFKPCQPQNTSVQQAEHTLTAEATNVSYQWVDCDNDFVPVDSATKQNFSPSESGNYAVIITSDNGCTDTSNCFMVTATAVVESTYGHEIEVYPNPANDHVIFDFKEQKSELQLNVLNMKGHIVDSRIFKGIQRIQYELDIPSGVYWFHITSDRGESAYLKVVKL